MPENNNIMSLEGQLVGMPLAGPESFSQKQLDYLKRALGVDETVLWEGADATSFTTSEAIENFDEIHFYVNGGEGTNKVMAKAVLPMGWTDYSSNLAFSYGAPYSIDGTLAITWTTRYSRSNNTFTFTSSYYGGGSGSTPTANGNNNVGHMYKVVGIHRIAGGNK